MVFASGDVPSFGAFAAARELDLRIPGVITVCCLDDIDSATLYEVPLTTVNVPTFEMWRRSARTIIRKRGYWTYRAIIR